MTELFINSKCDPLSLENSYIGSLMFADDLLVLSESKEGLQESLNKFSLYCKEWQLTVNCNKTKTMIFGKYLKNIKNTKFSYRNTYLENISEFKFLRNVITQNRNFVSCAEALSKKAPKVMYSIKSYTCSLNELPVNVPLFDSLVRPILTYNCEIWNMDDYKPYFNATERAKKDNFNVDQM
jgi:hypothetical protein